MDSFNLFFNKEKKRFYYIGEEKKCSLCDSTIENVIALKTSFPNKKIKLDFLCAECYREEKIKSVKFFGELKIAVIVSEPPKGSILVSLKFPPLSMSSNNQDALSIKADVTVDRCKVAHDPNRNIMPEYEKEKLNFERREALLNNNIKDGTQADDFLSSLKDATPMIEGGDSDKKEIGDESVGEKKVEIKRNQPYPDKIIKTPQSREDK